MNLILASASPRRREILSCLGIPFAVRTAETDEHCDIADPAGRVMAIAARKCQAVREMLCHEDGLGEDTVILAADTLVTLDGVFLGKPADRADACRMIRLLQGTTHTVASGIALWYRGQAVTGSELTEVTFAPMTDREVEAYVDTGEPFGKAGGYAIQGQAARYICGIRGDYFNVVGLPVHRLFVTARDAFGITL